MIYFVSFDSFLVNCTINMLKEYLFLLFDDSISIPKGKKYI